MKAIGNARPAISVVYSRRYRYMYRAVSEPRLPGNCTAHLPLLVHCGLRQNAIWKVMHPDAAPKLQSEMPQIAWEMDLEAESGVGKDGTMGVAPLWWAHGM